MAVASSPIRMTRSFWMMSRLSPMNGSPAVARAMPMAAFNSSTEP